MPPITSRHDAANIMAAVAEAVAAGRVTPSEAAEIGKVIDIYVRASNAAELDGGVADYDRLTDAQLHAIARGGLSDEELLALPPPDSKARNS